MANDYVDRQYARRAASYDSRWAVYTSKTLSATLSQIDLSGSERILDVGCGTGELERLLLDRWPGVRIVAIDLCEAMLDQARKKFAHDDYVEFCVANAENLRWPDGTFDIVLSCNAFHYFRNPKGVLAEFSRVLRPGGQCAVTDWCKDFVSTKALDLCLRIFDRAHFHTYGLEECRQRFDEAGLIPGASQRFKIDWLWGLMTVSATKP